MTSDGYFENTLPNLSLTNSALSDKKGEGDKAIWAAVQAWMEGQVAPADFAAWVMPLNFLKKDGGRVVLAVPTMFMQDWVKKHYRDPIAEGWRHVTGKDVAVDFDVVPVWQSMGRDGGGATEVLGGTQGGPKDKSEVSNGGATGGAAATAKTHDWLAGNELDARYSFDSFVTGKSNQFAFAAAQRVAEEMGSFNPFFLHGGVGLGKTHLMQAVGHALKARNPDVVIQYLSAEQFLYTFIRAIREKNTLAFKELFRAVDVLMIDDIQFIAGKESTQEEFFHTFNTLVSLGKQVILTADKSPHDLPNIEDRLRSRLGSGLAIEVHAPDVETRQAILEQKAASMDLELPHDVSVYLATNIASNVRELEGALNRLAAFSRLTGQELTIAFAKDQLRDLLRVQTKVVGMDDIQKQVAEYFKIRVADLHAPRRDRAVARPRQVAMYLCKQLTSRSYPDIGRAFGGRDHTTVMHACQQIVNLLERDARLVEDVKLLEQMLTAR
ncbi:MAG: chromosomal replication initiator protein DnaA [Alphaproteobacteria bacterium CG_4_10_14_0_8_um_filter_53_9]|nr:MAG: chromosomal replication initiator protein DnaA [Alphaproteobacteria bacterium CG_4_10_14_0_8_um_filter_53_9]